MKQVLQSLKSGKILVDDVPVPQIGALEVLVKTSYSLISPGTERMLLEFGNANVLGKVLRQPDKVRVVIEKIKSDGLVPTLEAVLGKLDQPLPLGYCNVGIVEELGEHVRGFKVGDRVVSNGYHACYNSLGINMCSKIPDEVSDEQAAFVVMGSIALQGIRLLKPNLGETVVVTGLGMVGLLAVQLLCANGCRVVGVDFNSQRLALAKSFGAAVVDLSKGQDPVGFVHQYSRGRGADCVLITTATASSVPIRQAAEMCRKRGKVVLTGTAGLKLSRDEFFKKEITFQVSASYGPGRYDANYEEKGQDYPVGYVRWTENRNFEAVLDMIAEGNLNLEPLITHKFNIQNVEKAYELILGDTGALGILIFYPTPAIAEKVRTIELKRKSRKTNATRPMLSFIGSGNYAASVLIPMFKACNAGFNLVCSNRGVSGTHFGKKFGFKTSTTEIETILSDNETDGVIISTRHDTHAKLVMSSLASGKHVFVEKPLCLNLGELRDIEELYWSLDKPPILMVGFNRRFSPHIVRLKSMLANIRGKKSFIMTVNAGALSLDHWVQDPIVGGGRIVGEVCHFIDLIMFLCSEKIVHSSKTVMDDDRGDTCSICLKFEGGSIATIHYFANGTKSVPKERLEVFANEKVFQLNNFRVLTGFGSMNFKKFWTWRQDKGHKICAATFMSAIKGEVAAPISPREIFDVSRVAIELAQKQKSEC